MGFIMYKKLLISLLVCSSIFAMELDNMSVTNGLPLILPLGWQGGRHPWSSSQHSSAVFQNSDPAQQITQERTIFGFKCPKCPLPIKTYSEVDLRNEVRRHFFVSHAMVVTGIELQKALEGKNFVTEDTIFV
jgi:hypothetical protein